MNLLVETKITDFTLSQISKGKKDDLEIFNRQLKIDKIIHCGDWLIALDGVSVILYDPKEGKIIRCPAIGELLHIEKRSGKCCYNIYYKSPKGEVIVDAIEDSKFISRRNLIISSKYPIESVQTNGKYVVVIDSEKNIEIINNKDIHFGNVIHSFKSRSFTTSREKIFGLFSRIMSSNFHAEAYEGLSENNINLYVVGGYNYNVYKIVVNKNTMGLNNDPEYLFNLRKADFDLKAVNAFLMYAESSLIDIKNIQLISARSNSNFAYISYEVKNKERNNSYEHIVLDISNNNNFSIINKFETDSEFRLTRILPVKYQNEEKVLALEINQNKSKIKYVIVNNDGVIEKKGESNASLGDCSIFGIIQDAKINDEIINEFGNKEEELVE